MNDFNPTTERGGCHVMAKPSGPVCNLNCTYCFYLEKEKLYPERQQNWRMDDETLEQYICQQIEAQDTKEVFIAWQGGEPTLLGLAFYRRAIEIQEKYSEGRTISHTFQTNGLLLDDEWCAFFKENNFLIGLSLDGPEHLHNRYRLNRSGRGSYGRVVEALRCLQKHQVEFNILCTVNNCNVHHPSEVYQHLTSLGARHIQFIPIVERQGNNADENGLYLVDPDKPYGVTATPWSVDPHAYGLFLTEIFDIWVRRDVGRVFVQQFDSNLATTMGRGSQVCHFSETCGFAFVLEANGDLYICDHFVEPRYKLGNIHQMSIREMNNSLQAHQFGQDKQISLPKECWACEFKHHCQGGCPKQRFAKAIDGRPTLNYLCSAYKWFFAHTQPMMRSMRDLIQMGRSPVEISKFFSAQPEPTHRKLTVSRNTNCPCKSGKKFKRCCGSH